MIVFNTRLAFCKGLSQAQAAIKHSLSVSAAWSLHVSLKLMEKSKDEN